MNLSEILNYRWSEKPRNVFGVRLLVGFVVVRSFAWSQTPRPLRPLTVSEPSFVMMEFVTKVSNNKVGNIGYLLINRSFVALVYLYS